MQRIWKGGGTAVQPPLACPTVEVGQFEKAAHARGRFVASFRRLCHPMATPHTAGAFRFGLRLTAIAGTATDSPDTPESATPCQRSARQTDQRGCAEWPPLYARLPGIYGLFFLSAKMLRHQG
jgi:hypothetical protein